MKTAHLLPEECKQEIRELLEKTSDYKPQGFDTHEIFTRVGWMNALKWVLEEEK